AARRGQEGFEFFRFAISGLVVNDTVPGRSRLWEEFQKERNSGGIEAIYSSTENLAGAFQRSPGIGTPADFRAHVRSFAAAGGGRSDHPAAAGGPQSARAHLRFP